MKRALVLGYGRSGKAAEKILHRQGFETVVLEGEDEFPEGRFSVAVVSPGVALTHPWIRACEKRAIPLKSELQLGCEALRQAGWKLLAVTGSKGKSSVVKLVADGIARAGHTAVPCGNYGTPVCAVADEAMAKSSRQAWAVVEISSFQLETTHLPADAFEAAVILNLQEDHLGRHGGVAVYHGLKLGLAAMARTAMRPEELAELASDSTMANLFADTYFDNAILRSNGAAGVWLMRAAGLDDSEVADAFRTFEPLPHRMQEIGVISAVRYVDDSKATSLAALAAGVTMCRRAKREPSVRLIAGGLPKGDDPNSVLSVLTSRVKKVYLIGQSARVFSLAWSKVADCEVCETLERAVEAVRHEAEEGETVLLSPGAASFDQFRSFEERGEVFARLVKKERKKR